ncbi:DUF5011 domain-containing protein [Verrucomicrobia bacterium]|nr:DUF5011 domain-containing protein [Verrucomicrobiota bacterium]
MPDPLELFQVLRIRHKHCCAPTRTVVVADTIAPVITLLGSSEMDVLLNATFTDPGSSVSDGFESGLTATVTGSVDTSTPGTYTLTYNVSDSAGNAATEVKRMVHVVATGSFQVGGSVLKQSSGSLIPMEGVTVSLLQDGESDTQLTDANGMYAISINASSGLKLTAQKPHEPGQVNRGVDVLDIVAIRKHILLRAPFTKSIEMVAADTNLDASVDVRDIVGIRKVILVRTDAFLEDVNGEKVSFWGFVASDFQSVDAGQSIDYSSINANINDADFLAVKLGDVNDDWSAPSSSTPQNVYVGGRRPQTERFTLGFPREMEDVRVAQALHANQLRGLLALQLDLHWDPEVLALDGIHSHALTGFDARIHTGHIKGSTRIAWDDAALEGVDLDKDQSIIQLVFSRQPSVKRSSPIHVKNLILQDDGGAFRGEQTALGYYHPEGNTPLKGQGLMRSMRLEDGNLHLEFETRPGQSYVIETKQSLAKGDWQTWKVVQPIDQSHAFQVPVNQASDRYFRLRQIEFGLQR